MKKEHKFNIYRQYDGQEPIIYSTNPYSEKGAKKLLNLIKITLVEGEGRIIAESKDGFYARSCKYSTPVSFWKELIN